MLSDDRSFTTQKPIGGDRLQDDGKFRSIPGLPNCLQVTKGQRVGAYPVKVLG